MGKRDGWAGTAFWLCFGLLIAFGETHRLWFDNMTNDGKGVFWANVAVAMGTLGLAAVTAYNVLQTREVMSAEDRRHQQQFAPLCRFKRDRSTLAIVNVGMGLALDVKATARIRYPTSQQHNVQLSETQDELAALKLAHPNGFVANQSYQRQPADPPAIIGRMVPHFIWNVPTDVNELFEMETSALAKDEETYMPDRDGIISYASENETFEVTLSYFDMFGNSYESKYLDDTLGEYEWIRPAKLHF